MNRHDRPCGRCGENHVSPLECYGPPRWTPGSLAEAIRYYVSGSKEADAVERLTNTASSLLSIIEEYMRGDDLDYKTVRKELDGHRDVIEMAEKWAGR